MALHELSVAAKCRRRPGVRTQEVADELLLLDEDGLIHHLNQTASFIWRQCDGDTSVDDIARSMAREFDVSEAVAAKDVVQVVDQLSELKLLSDQPRGSSQ